MAANLFTFVNDLAIFDFDGTLTVGEDKPSEYYPGNQKIIDEFQKLRNTGKPCMILTARPIESMIATKINCRQLGIFPSRIVVNRFNEDHSFKTDWHKLIVNTGWKITDCYGNNETDFSEFTDGGVWVNKDGSFNERKN